MLSRIDNIYEFGNFRLETANHSLLCDGHPVSLKPKSLDMLRLLIENRGRVMSKDELMESLWPDTFVEEANLTQTIYELRRALGESAKTPRIIENIPKRGYRFAADVRKIASNQPEFNGESLPIRSLAVLPFCSLMNEDRDESFELGIAETLITGLSGLGRMILRPTSSIRQFADPQQDPFEAGRKLRVDAVLHGTIQRSVNDRFRLSARLVNVENEMTIWAGQFDEQSADIFLVQDSLLKKILQALSVKLTAGEHERLRKKDTEDPEVHRLLLLCRYHWHKWTPENWKRSIGFGKEASLLDPFNAPSYAWTAASYCTLGIFGSMPPGIAFETAKKLVEKSLDLDNERSKAHEIHGAIKLFYDWDWQAIPKTLERAVSLNPSSATAHNLMALFFVANRQFEKAEERIRLALSIDPLSLLTNADLGFILFYSRRYEEANAQFLQTLELDPHFAHAHYGRGIVHIQMGDYEKGIDCMRKAAEYSASPSTESAALGFAYACSGMAAETEQIIDKLDQKSRDEYVDSYKFAILYSGLRDVEKTLLYLNNSYDNRSSELIYLACNPQFDWLRENARFCSLLSKIGIQ